MFFLTVFILALSDQTNYSVTLLEEVADYTSAAAQPLAIVAGEEQHFVLDQAFNLWILSDQARRAAQPTQLEEGAAFRSFYRRGDQLVLLDRNGFRSVAFSLDGRRLGTRVGIEGALYNDPTNHVDVVQNEPGSLALNWRHQGAAKHITLLPDQADDQLPGAALDVVQRDRHLLVISNSGTRNTLYYALLHLDKGTALVGSHPLTEAPPTQYARLSRGTTAQDKYGFVVTEQAQNDHCRLHFLDPETNQWQTRTIELGGLTLSHFQHLGEDTWLAFDGNGLQRLTLKPAP